MQLFSVISASVWNPYNKYHCIVRLDFSGMRILVCGRLPIWGKKTCVLCTPRKSAVTQFTEQQPSDTDTMESNVRRALMALPTTCPLHLPVHHNHGHQIQRREQQGTKLNQIQQAPRQALCFMCCLLEKGILNTWCTATDMENLFFPIAIRKKIKGSLHSRRQQGMFPALPHPLGIYGASQRLPIN